METFRTNTYILKCPCCGTEKEVGFSSAFNTMGDYQLWSDSRIEGKGWLVPAYTQQCPNCATFYTLPPRKSLKIKKQECTDTGFLPLDKLKLAIVEFAGDEIAEPRARLEAWWAFNSLYHDPMNAPVEEQEFNKSNMQWLIDFHTPRSTRFSHLLFELNRLLGNKDICEEMINALSYEEFIKQRKQYCKDNNIKDDIDGLDETLLKRRYEDLVNELEYALKQPLKTFVKSL